MHVACALESVLARHASTRRPVPDMQALSEVTVRDEMEPVL